ncbi:MAG: hypothetical protein HKN87_20720 [Saprospiraceae bacterium]|nr:hypothetical protein [Saprospiraceae bacterium]
MKALLLTLLLPFSTFFSDFNSTAVGTTDHLGAKKVEIEVEVDLGRKKKGCSGFGVCKIKGGTKIMGALEGSRSTATATTENGRVTSMTFHRSSMNEATLRKFFSSDNFLVGESFLLEFQVDGESYKAGLRAGKHKINRTKNGFNIGMPPV